MNGNLPVITPETALVRPDTGELIHLEDPVACASALDQIRRMENEWREAKRVLIGGLKAESERQGSKTLHLDYMDVTIGGGEETVYDPEVLLQLRDAGLPEDRFDALVRAEVTYKVSAYEADRIAKSNPVYAEIIERSKSIRDKAITASVKMGRSRK